MKKRHAQTHVLKNEFLKILSVGNHILNRIASGLNQYPFFQTDFLNFYAFLETHGSLLVPGHCRAAFCRLHNYDNIGTTRTSPGLSPPDPTTTPTPVRQTSRRHPACRTTPCRGGPLQNFCGGVPLSTITGVPLRFRLPGYAGTFKLYPVFEGVPLIDHVRGGPAGAAEGVPFENLCEGLGTARG